MSDNVLIFGAGFSFQAGIPMLGQFADTMWDIAARKSFQGTRLEQADCEIFDKAAAVRTMLDGYHGRANFDERNIEDILSILAIGAHANDADAARQLTDVRRAIARTIELTCLVRHPALKNGEQFHRETKGMAGHYLDFWRAMFSWASTTGKLPTIITFNYDLVLERSLFHFFNGTHTGGKRNELLPQKRLRVRYHYGALESALFDVVNCTWGWGPEGQPGTGMRQVNPNNSGDEMEVEILKLHGSVNFPHQSTELMPNIVGALDDPNILPPIFNKLSNVSHAKIWDVALKRIRAARNVVVVGYSLPQSDIYMQYFLKAGLGPNRDFDRLTVFDPVLFRDTDANNAMRQRYADCFAQQMRKRIEFNPPGQGSGYDFIATLNNDPSRILF